jgi:Cof subfamily protein (haloacid dehalogenase superfamily)
MSIRLVVSDVDGTLVQPDKSLSPGTIAAAGRLRAAGVTLALVSARPPRGIVPLGEELGGHIMLAGFNGGTILDVHGKVAAEMLVPAAAAAAAHGLFRARGVFTWVFADNEWLLDDPSGPRIPLERRTVRFQERVVDSLDPYLDRAGKLVGVSDDYAKLAAVETELQALLGTTANAHRSQDYYLDVTHPDANKGHAVRALAAQLGLGMDEVLVLGDMPNDLAMFDVGAASVAMGNGADVVKQRATWVTARNDEDGWAMAIDRHVLAQPA